MAKGHVHKNQHSIDCFFFPLTRGFSSALEQVEAEAEEWTAVGFPVDGSMVGSDVVIYLPELDEVSEHILGSQVRERERGGCYMLFENAHNRPRKLYLAVERIVVF